MIMLPKNLKAARLGAHSFKWAFDVLALANRNDLNKYS